MTIRTKTIGRLPQNKSEWDPNYVNPGTGQRGYGQKFRVFRYGCELESKIENNTYDPFDWDGDQNFVLDVAHWELCSGNPKVWAAGNPKPASTDTTGDYPYNGMGRVVIPKNMVDIAEEGEPENIVNLLTQAAFEDGDGNPLTNTVFVIQYDFTLGEDITVPANCVLEFDGGSISGAYTLTGANTGINAGLVKIFNTDVTLAGTWNVKEAYPEWFGAIGDGVTNDSSYLQECVDFGIQNNVPTILTNTYYVSSPINIDISWERMWNAHPYSIIGNSGKIIIDTSSCLFTTTLRRSGNPNAVSSGQVIFKNIFFTSPENNKRVVDQHLFRLTFENCTFMTPLLTASDCTPQTIYLDHCYMSRFAVQFFYTDKGCHDIRITGCQVEAAYASLLALNTDGVQGVDFVLDNTLIENIHNAPAIFMIACSHGVVNNCYFEGNKKGHISGMSGGATNGLVLTNNLFDSCYADEGDTVYKVSWWGTTKAMSIGNIGLSGSDGHYFRVKPSNFMVNDFGYPLNSFTVADTLPSDINNGLREGVQVFNKTTGKLNIYDGTNWIQIN